MVNRCIWTTTSLLLLMVPGTLWAGPWTKEPGQAYVKFSQLYFSSDTYVDTQGRRVSGTDYAATTSAIYAEVGLPLNLQVQGFLPYILSRNYFDAEETSYANLGFGDALLALQWTPIRTQIPWAIRLEGKLPLYDLSDVRGPRAMQFPALGEGQLDMTLWASLGASLHPLPVYMLGEVGYRHRTAVYFGEDNGRRYKDTFVFNSQIGSTLGDRVLIAANLGGTIALGEDEVTQSFVTLGPSVAVYLWKKLAVEATISPMVYAKNNSPGTSYSLGLSFQR